MNTKNISLIIVLCAVIAAIWYLESSKQPAAKPVEIVVGEATSTPVSAIAGKAPTEDRGAIRSAKSLRYPRLKEIADPSGFINADPFKLADIAGKKVVLIDFWTYSCINCRRTIPYLNAWYAKYKDLGLEIVGVHTPEFDFEKEYANVSQAAKELGVRYPVVLDSDRATWTAYQNLYWPREYLVDIDGFIVHDHIGEGSYGETERAIQAALRERSDALGLGLSIPDTLVDPSDAISLTASRVDSPETYFGSARNQYLGNGTRGAQGIQALSIPTSLAPNTLYLGGAWDFRPEYAESAATSTRIAFSYTAKNVYLVASSATSAPLRIFVDGKLVKTVVVKDHELYTLVEGKEYGSHTLEIEVGGSGLDAFTFTFG